jgi:hypothetical protein
MDGIRSNEVFVQAGVGQLDHVIVAMRDGTRRPLRRAWSRPASLAGRTPARSLM